MATTEQCRDALQTLIGRLASGDGQQVAGNLDRSISCFLPDLGVTWSGRLRNGQLHDLTTEAMDPAQIRLTTSSDDLLALTDGTLAFPAAWASGRVKVQAGVLDLLKLRSLL